MSARRIELLRQRDVGSLFADAFVLYFRHLVTFVVIGAAVAVPVELLVSGLGLGQLTAPFREPPSQPEVAVLVREAASVAITLLAGYLVTVPLIKAMTIRAVLDAGEGRRPVAGRSIRSGVELYPRLVLPVALAGLGIALSFVLLILPAIYLAVRWYLVPQAVVIDGAASPRAALARSSELVRGSWWRALGIQLLIALVVSVPAVVLLLPFQAAAQAADSAALELVGIMVVNTLATPLSAVAATLLYFDLRARREGGAAAGVPRHPGPPEGPDIPPEGRGPALPTPPAPPRAPPPGPSKEPPPGTPPPEPPSPGPTGEPRSRGLTTRRGPGGP